MLVVKWLVVRPPAGLLEASSYKRKGINKNEEQQTNLQKTDETTFVEILYCEICLMTITGVI